MEHLFLQVKFPKLLFFIIDFRSITCEQKLPEREKVRFMPLFEMYAMVKPKLWLKKYL